MQLFIKLTTSFTTGFYSALNHLDHGGRVKSNVVLKFLTAGCS